MIDSPRHDEVLTTRMEPVDLATRWPQFSERELARLRFLVYRRQMGRIPPPAPVRAEVDALCAALLATSRPPDPQPPQRPIPDVFRDTLPRSLGRWGTPCVPGVMGPAAWRGPPATATAVATRGRACAA